MDSGKVTVIIPAYNAELYIKETVDSVIKQTYKNLEIIIVDDGSKDSTGIIADEYSTLDNRVVTIHQKNGGLPAARNTGIKASKGKYFFFLDADDWLEPDCIEKLVECQCETDADLVFFSYVREYQNKSEEYHVYRNKSFYEKNGKQELYLFDMRIITAWGKLYTRRVMENLLYDEGMRTAEDVDFNYRIYENVNKAVYLPVCLLHYRILPKSAIHGYDPKVLEKFTYPVTTVRERLSKGTLSQKEAYFSFATIAYIVITQNGIALNKELSLSQKLAKIKELNRIDWVVELFNNTQFIRVPLSRKALVLFGKYKLNLGILAAINIKQGLNG